MSLESDLVTTIGALCSGRVYPDIAPHDTARPYVVWMQVGGEAVNPLDNEAPGVRHARIQINVWHDTRKSANELMYQIEDALRPTPFNGRPLGALISRFDEASTYRGAQQDFYFWR